MRFIIDGNNLLHTYAALGPTAVGRQHLCEIVGRWASRADADVVLVFDGPSPLPGLRQQMQCDGLDIRFSETRTADDVIEALVAEAGSPANLCIITSDHAVAHAARHRRCRWITSQDFVRMLTAPATARRNPPPTPEKPDAPGPQEADEWMQRFNIPPADPDDLTDLMQ